MNTIQINQIMKKDQFTRKIFLGTEPVENNLKKSSAPLALGLTIK